MHHASLVNNSQYADKFFSLNGEIISTHTIIIGTRCPDLYKKNIANKKKKKPQYELSQINYLTYEIFVYLLHYLYTGTICFEGFTLEPSNLVRLYCASEDYALPHLKKETHKKLLANIDKRNVYKLWKLCNDLGIKPESNVCNTYIALHYDELLADKKYGKEFNTVKRPTTEEIKQAARAQDRATRDAFKYTKDEKWEFHFKVILRKAINADFKIISDQQPKDGIQCHKSILSGHSMEMALFVEKIPNGEFMSTLTPPAIQALLNWVYCGEKPDDPTIAAQLLPFANTFKLPQLVKFCEDLLTKSINHSTVLYILQVTMDLTDITASQPHLKRACMDYIIKNLPTIDFNPLRQMPPPTAIEVITAVQQSIGKNWIIDSFADSSTTVEVQMLPTSTDAGIVNLKRLTIDESEKDNLSEGSDLSNTETPRTSTSTSEEVVVDETFDDGVVEVNGINDQDNFHLQKLQDNKAQNHPIKLQKLKRKKLQGVKDLDDVFG